MSEINSQFFNGKTYSATDFVESNKNTMKDGILPNTDFFKVLPAGNMTIGVTSGRGWIQGHAFSSDSTLSFTIDSADGVLDRIDTVVIRLDLTTDNEKIECLVVKGALGGSATAPVRDGTYYDLVIAQIAVAHGTTAITSAMITDKRGDSNLCGWSGAISAEQFDFDEKADKTYCDNTFATKVEHNSIVGGTIKTNADRLQDKAISATAPTVGQMLQFNGTQYAPTTCGYVSGVYTGNNTANREINIGFRPKALVLFAYSYSHNEVTNKIFYQENPGPKYEYWGGIITDNTNYTPHGLSVITLSNNGFIVSNNIAATTYYNYTNCSAIKYGYIAFR